MVQYCIFHMVVERIKLMYIKPFSTVLARELGLNQFSSVSQSCPTLCYIMRCSMQCFPVHHQLPELAQTHVHPVSHAIQPSHLVFPLSSYLQSFSASGSFPMSQFFTLLGQSIGASASASVLPMNIQD